MPEVPAIRPCAWQWLGRVDYAEGLALQQRRVEARQGGEVEDALFLLEHPPVITLGRGADAEHILQDEKRLAQRGVQIHETGRGGDVTYHGPGQVVGYPIIDLNPDRRDVHRYVRDLEEIMIRAAADHGVAAHRIEGLTGVWVGREKLAAIGVRISRWVTSHGFAFNVHTDLDFFNLIVPCGISDHGVTSLERILGRKVDLQAVAARLAHHFGDVYARQMVRSAQPS